MKLPKPIDAFNVDWTENGRACLIAASGTGMNYANPERILPAGQGVCSAIWSDELQRCILLGNNCVEGSPEVYESEYMGMKVCACRCD